MEQSAWRPLHPSAVLYVPGRVPLLLLQAGSVNYSCAICCMPEATLMALLKVVCLFVFFDGLVFRFRPKPRQQFACGHSSGSSET